MDGKALSTTALPEEHGSAPKTTITAGGSTTGQGQPGNRSTVELSQQRQQGGEEKSNDEGSVSGYSQPASVENTHSGEAHLESAPASGEGTGGDEVTDATQAERDEPLAPVGCEWSQEEEDKSDSALSSRTSTASDSHDDETDDETDLADDTAVSQTVSTSAAVATESDITVTVAQDDGGVIHVEEEDTLEESPLVPSTGELNCHTGNGVVEDNPTTAADSVAAVAGSTGPTPVLSSPVSEGSVFGPVDPPNSAADSSGPINNLGQPDTTPALSSTVAESVASHDPPDTSSTQRHNQEPQPTTSAAPTHVESTQLAQASRNSDVSLGMQATQTPSLPTDNSRNVSLSRIHHTQCSDGIPLGEEESPDDTLVVVIQPAEAAEVPRKRCNRSATQRLLRLLENPNPYMRIAGPSSTVSLVANRQPDAAAAVTGTPVQAETAPSGDVSPQQPTTKDLTLSSSESSENEVESNGSSAASATAAAVSEGSDDFEAEADQMTEGETSPPPQHTDQGVEEMEVDDNSVVGARGEQLPSMPGMCRGFVDCFCMVSFFFFAWMSVALLALVPSLMHSGQVFISQQMTPSALTAAEIALGELSQLSSTDYDNNPLHVPLHDPIFNSTEMLPSVEMSGLLPFDALREEDYAPAAEAVLSDQSHNDSLPIEVESADNSPVIPSTAAAVMRELEPIFIAMASSEMSVRSWSPFDALREEDYALSAEVILSDQSHNDSLPIEVESADNSPVITSTAAAVMRESHDGDSLPVETASADSPPVIPYSAEGIIRDRPEANAATEVNYYRLYLMIALMIFTRALKRSNTRGQASASKKPKMLRKPKLSDILPQTDTGSGEVGRACGRERSRGRADVRGRVKSARAVNPSCQENNQRDAAFLSSSDDSDNATTRAQDIKRGKRLRKHPDKSICKSSVRQDIGEVEPTATCSGTGSKRKVVEGTSGNSMDVCKKRLKDSGSSFPRDGGGRGTTAADVGGRGLAGHPGGEGGELVLPAAPGYDMLVSAGPGDGTLVPTAPGDGTLVSAGSGDGTLVSAGPGNEARKKPTNGPPRVLQPVDGGKRVLLSKPPKELRDATSVQQTTVPSPTPSVHTVGTQTAGDCHCGSTVEPPDTTLNDGQAPASVAVKKSQRSGSTITSSDGYLTEEAGDSGSAGGHKKRKRDEEDPEGERPVKRGKCDEDATSKIAHEDRTQPPAGSRETKR